MKKVFDWLAGLGLFAGFIIGVIATVDALWSAIVSPLPWWGYIVALPTILAFVGEVCCIIMLFKCKKEMCNENRV